MSTKDKKHRDILTISQLNRRAKQLLEGNFPSVWIEGEISNLARPSSGHWYFSLKDDKAQVRCAMFRNSNMRLRFQPEQGQQVLVRAKLSLYEARGDYQLIAEHMELAGDGAMARAFEELKAKLQAEGLFDAAYKQDLPDIPEHIAVVTSPSGAAVRDILTVLNRRFPLTKVTIIPTLVQGNDAPATIAQAIIQTNKLASKYGFDVIIAGRGGGSTEDLWAFNSELVARAIHNSELPIVSAVGHEVDFTIADFVADVRAPTPSAAAELLSPDNEELLLSFSGFEQLLDKQIKLQISQHKQQLNWLQARLRHPGSRLQEHSQRLDDIEARLYNSCKSQLKQQKHRLAIINSQLLQQTPRHQINEAKAQLASTYQLLEQLTEKRLASSKERFGLATQLLNTVSPLATLERGYSYTRDSKGKVISSIKGITSGATISTKLTDGTIESTVSTIKKG